MNKRMNSLRESIKHGRRVNIAFIMNELQFWFYITATNHAQKAFQKLKRNEYSVYEPMNTVCCAQCQGPFEVIFCANGLIIFIAASSH